MVLKQFIQFCLIIIYPLGVRVLSEGPAVLRTSIPLSQNHPPGEYAANRAKYKKK